MYVVVEMLLWLCLVSAAAPVCCCCCCCCSRDKPLTVVAFLLSLPELTVSRLTDRDLNVKMIVVVLELIVSRGSKGTARTNPSVPGRYDTAEQILPSFVSNQSSNHHNDHPLWSINTSLHVLRSIKRQEFVIHNQSNTHELQQDMVMAFGGYNIAMVLSVIYHVDDIELNIINVMKIIENEIKRNDPNGIRIDLPFT